jgi:hypothetical protein
VKGALTGSGTTWTLALTSVTTQGNVKIKVDNFGAYNVTTGELTVEVFAADVTPPTVVSVTPSGDGAATSGNVVITFNKAMNTTPGTVQLNSTALTGTGTWSEGNTIFTIPYSGLSNNTTYTVNISGFKDAANNTMTTNGANSFTTAPAATTDVTFTAVQTGGTSNIANSTGIVLTFAPSVTGLTADHITITNGTGAVVKGALTGSGTTWTIALTSVTTQGNVKVKVDNFGAYNVITDELTVDVYKTIVLFVGAGTSSNPYLITNETDLKNMRDEINAGRTTYANANIYYRQTDNIEITGASWTPIGNNVSLFRGIYNGGGFAISKLTITGSSSQQGLFGYIASTGEVRNIALTDVNINVPANEIGGVAGYNTGRIEFCYVTGSIAGAASVAGVAGSNGNVVENCYTTCSVTGTGGNVGGIVGSNGRTVNKCYATGAIRGNGQVGGVGGIVGGNAGTNANVTNCVALNFAVRSNATSAVLLGRVVGANAQLGKSSNNFARIGMTVQYNYNGVTGTDATITADANGIHGSNVDAPNYNGASSDSWWKGSVPGFTEGTVLGRWSLAANRLPWLAGFNETQNPTAQ